MTQTEFVNIIKLFKDKLFRLAKRLLVSKEEAEDATQEVLLKLWNKKNDFKKVNNVEAYAMTLIKNFCLDKLKSKGAQNLKIEHNNYKTSSETPQKTLETNDSLDWVSKIIETLPEQQKIIVQLRDIEQYDLDEIAKLLEMNNTAVRVALSRARKTIREQLTQTHNYGVK